ncbi:MAG: hypothetical protein MK066_10015 [Crocinitomicaceae bacterium]|nr:hypothetical protein [Crocinitomicaceae bacterium]
MDRFSIDKINRINLMTEMKVLKSLLVGAIVLTTLTAQGQSIAERSPEAIAEAQTEQMVTDLNLTPEQAEKVGFLNLKVENKIKAVYLNSNLTNEQKKEFVEGNKKDRMGALKAILTAEQFTLYQTKITEAKASQLK